ncbi:MAG: M20 family metallopeptidase [Fuerstiella sp.]
MHSLSESILDSATTSEIDRFASEHEPAWIAYRRERHCSPEPSGEETETSHSVCERLKSLGIEAAIPDRGVGVVGDLLLGSATPETPAIAVRADIDALRMTDRKEVGYASIKPELAHACGHDAHTTVVLSVAEILAHLNRQQKKADRSTLNARIRFLFQSAEETGEGALWMVQDGYLRDVQSILGLHVEPNLLAGQIGIRYGVFTAQVDEITLCIRGRGGHTARPHSTTDPIHCGCQLVTTLYQFLPRSIDVRDAAVFSVGEFHAGHASNVIPDEVTIVGTLRTTSHESREDLLRRIRETCDHFAQLTGNEIEVQVGHSLGSVVNSDRETRAMETAAESVVGADAVTILDRPSMGGEDFAAYLTECKGCQIRLGCAGSLPWPHLHSPVFDIDESAIAIGARVIARAALELGGRLPTSG